MMGPPKKPPHGAVRAGDRPQEESIYNVGGNAYTQQGGPKVRVYATGPPPTQAVTKPRMHIDSSQISGILNPVHGVRDAQLRQGIKPANHALANRKAVKEASQMNALRKAADQEQDQLQGGRPSLSRNSSQRTSPCGPPPAARLSADGRDFLAENRMAAAAPTKAARVEPQDEGLKYLHKRDYGRVPTYLLERKLELAEAAALAEKQKELAMVPPGMRLLPEEERQETLSILARNRQDVERALQGLPIIIETPSAIRRKNELEQRLNEIDAALKVFGRPKVLVQL